MPHKVLCLLAEGFEELETLAPVDLLRRAGAEVVMAALGDGIHVTGRSGVTLHADARLSDVGDSVFDLLLIPGGPAVSLLRSDGRAAALAKAHAKAGKPIAAICAAPLVLHDAGLLAGRRFTAHFSTAAELPGALPKHWVEDGALITANGAGVAVEFGLLLVKRLFGEAKAEEIARSIML